MFLRVRVFPRCNAVSQALILIAGCDDAATGLDTDDIAGTWTATSIVFTQTADPMTVVDAVDEGASLTLLLGTDESFTFTFTSPEENEVDTGTYSVSGSTITLTGSTETETFAITRDEDTMTLTDDDVFEFDEQVGDEAATLVVTLTR